MATSQALPTPVSETSSTPRAASTLAELVYDDRELAEAVRLGDTRIEGDESAVEHFLTLFPLPEPAAPAAPGRPR